LLPSTVGIERFDQLGSLAGEFWSQRSLSRRLLRELWRRLGHPVGQAPRNAN